MYVIIQTNDVCVGSDGKRRKTHIVMADTFEELPTGGDISHGDIGYILAEDAEQRLFCYSETTHEWESQSKSE